MLDDFGQLIDCEPVSVLLDPFYSATKGDLAWPPLAMFVALLLSIWYDLSNVKTEATPERTAFVRFCRELVAHKLDPPLFTTVTAQLTSKAISNAP